MLRYFSEIHFNIILCDPAHDFLRQNLNFTKIKYPLVLLHTHQTSVKQLYTHNSSVAWLTLSLWNVGNRNPWFYQKECVNESKFNSTHTQDNIISMLHPNSEHSAHFWQWLIHYTNSKLDTVQSGILHIEMFWDVALCSAVQGTSTYECIQGFEPLSFSSSF